MQVCIAPSVRRPPRPSVRGTTRRRSLTPPRSAAVSPKQSLGSTLKAESGRRAQQARTERARDLHRAIAMVSELLTQLLQPLDFNFQKPTRWPSLDWFVIVRVKMTTVSFCFCLFFWAVFVSQALVLPAPTVTQEVQVPLRYRVFFVKEPVTNRSCQALLYPSFRRV
jgi:hypothetical protein